MNQTNYNHTEESYNNPINQSATEKPQDDVIDSMDDAQAYIELIKENINYDHHMKYDGYGEKELYDELFGIICEVVCVKRKSIRVAGEDYPYELVKSRFLKLNSSHLEYVIGCMKETTTKITNIKSQLFNLLCDKADDVYNGRLPIHVRCLLDEFANIGQIPQFEKLIATIRSREISASIILQSKSQLKALYRDNASTIEGNCDTTLFLGGKEKDTLKDLAEILGKETIDLYNISDTRGTSQSYGLNYQKTGKELMSQDEIAVMDGSKCIMQLRGVRPFFSDKFDITKHKQYPLLSDYDKKNEFHVEEYMKHQMEVRLSPEEAFDLYVYEGSELEKQSNSENEGTEHVT